MKTQEWTSNQVMLSSQEWAKTLMLSPQEWRWILAHTAAKLMTQSLTIKATRSRCMASDNKFPLKHKREGNTKAHKVIGGEQQSDYVTKGD
jgi:hypothetical protein